MILILKIKEMKSNEILSAKPYKIVIKTIKNRKELIKISYYYSCYYIIIHVIIYLQNFSFGMQFFFVQFLIFFMRITLFHFILTYFQKIKIEIVPRF